jgi:hypothetical protein
MSFGFTKIAVGLPFFPFGIVKTVCTIWPWLVVPNTFLKVGFSEAVSYSLIWETMDSPRLWFTEFDAGTISYSSS